MIFSGIFRDFLDFKGFFLEFFGIFWGFFGNLPLVPCRRTIIAHVANHSMSVSAITTYVYRLK